MEAEIPPESGTRRVVPARVELAFFALLLGMLLAQLDTNIVVAALPRIGNDLDAGPAIAGVTAAYLLSVTVTTPIAGKLGDILGRRTVFAGSVLIFAAGSLACALAPSMLLLVAARAVQGVGGAGLIVTAVSTLGVLFDKTELIRRQVWLTAVTAIAALAGPQPAGISPSGSAGRRSSSSTCPSAASPSRSDTAVCQADLVRRTCVALTSSEQR